MGIGIFRFWNRERTVVCFCGAISAKALKLRLDTGQDGREETGHTLLSGEPLH